MNPPAERVLIADSDPGLRAQVTRRLGDAGIFSDGVGDGRSAIDQLAAGRYAVIVLGIALPHSGAERVLEYVRQLIPSERPVVLVLADGGAARSLDVDLVQIVLRKPCDLTQLSELVQSCVQVAVTHRSHAATVAHRLAV